MIQFEALSYTYPGASGPALTDVTLDIAAGEFVLVTGASGAGKSTLLRCLNGLVPHFSGGALKGTVRVTGRDPVTEGPQVLSRLVGFVFQDPEAQFVVGRVEDEIAFALEHQAIPRAEMRDRVADVLRLLDLETLRYRPLDTLSGGERQRVAIAAALALRPRILVLDEPTSQLDPRAAQEVLETLVRLHRDLGLTVVLAEHRLERVLPYVDRLIHLTGPRSPVLNGPPRAVLHQMEQTPPLVALGKALGWEPLPLTVEEGRAQIAGREVPRAELVSPLTHRDPLLAVRGLHFAYDGNEVLSGVDLCVASGELVVLMGYNGSGKTTLLRCITGLLRPRAGEIWLGGESLVGKGTAEICRTVGYLPQEPDDLLFADTVAEELAVTLRNHDLLERPPIDPNDLLERLDLGQLAMAYPRDLSVGQRQRVALGAVTVKQPRLLLLDEPTRGMDYRAKDRLARLLREWQTEGTGILLVTHDVEWVARMADRVVLLEGGRVAAAGAAAEVLPASPFTPQIAHLFPGTGWLTVEDALAGLS